MSSTFDIFSINTVPASYSWDKGTPATEFTDFVVTLSSCLAVSNNPLGVEYVGYAPFVLVSLSSSPGNISNAAVSVKRIANFGDYYNSESNIVTTSVLSSMLFCHTYIMPGLYTIQLTQTEYVEVTEQNFAAYGNCLQKHCINWSWKNLSTSTPLLSVTWATTLPGNSYEKKWKYESCNDEIGYNNGLYIQTFDKNKPNPLGWQWYNFLCNPGNSSYYNAVPWISSGFQQSNQITWNESVGPCVNLSQTEQTVWKWDYITCDTSSSQYATDITWDDTASASVGNTTWDHVQQYCTGTSSTLLSSYTQTIVKEAYIRVLEIPPTAYLSVIQPNDRTSPLTVRLSPRDTVCGSFPIEKIVWDLGDGSPLIVQRRWANTLEEPFVFSGALSNDYQDPRNYDIIHTYIKTPSSGFSFYPSITAYASSTNSSDCAAAVVGPLKLAKTNGSNFKLLQNELTEHGKILIGQVDNNVAVWRADK